MKKFFVGIITALIAFHKKVLATANIIANDALKYDIKEPQCDYGVFRPANLAYINLIHWLKFLIIPIAIIIGIIVFIMKKKKNKSKKEIIFALLKIFAVALVLFIICIVLIEYLGTKVAV